MALGEPDRPARNARPQPARTASRSDAGGRWRVAPAGEAAHSVAGGVSGSVKRIRVSAAVKGAVKCPGKCMEIAEHTLKRTLRRTLRPHPCSDTLNRPA